MAGRGEIAVRVARACAEAKIRSIAVYATEDRDALHVRVADEAFALPMGSGPAAYLDTEGIVALALRAGAEAVHPGYGFLSESPELARAVIEAGLAWVGPSPEVLEQLSNKIAARELAEKLQVPLVPASGVLTSHQDVQEFAATCGYPVVIKAVAGGGGRGMRVVRSAEGAEEALAACRREAIAAFGQGECFAEKYLERPRHVETQCLADREGTVAVISTRDCTLQRRHQKLIEEAPAPFLTAAQEQTLAGASRDLLGAVGYVGAATCEFLVAPTGEVYFLEVNPRLQVEHPVTEEVTGIDLVREQIRLAAGESLGYRDVLAYGHAIEFRINAEDPARGFLPAPGRIADLRLPGGPGVRCDFGYESGDTVSGAFDSMIGKVIVRGRDRAGALARARRALRELRVDGVASLRAFHRAVIDSPDFTAPTAAGFSCHTNWIEQDFAPVVASLPAADAPAATEAGPAPTSRMVVEVDGKRLEVVLPATLPGTVGPAAASPSPGPPRAPARHRPPSAGTKAAPAADAAVTAPMQGTVVRVAVTEGQSVAEGDLVVVLEAMKMEQPLVAPRAGTVKGLDGEPGGRVATGHVFCVIEA